MMNVFPAKWITVLVLYLILVVSLATSARLPEAVVQDGWKASPSQVSNYEDGAGTMAARQQGNLWFENLDINYKDIIPFRILRSKIPLLSPPSPVRSKPSSMRSAAPPPSVV